jgi:hypothetical protein
MLLDVIARDNPHCRVNRIWLTIASSDTAEITLEYPPHRSARRRPVSSAPPPNTIAVVCFGD